MFSTRSKGVLDPYSKSFVASIILKNGYAELSYQIDKFYFGYVIILSSGL
jgi:hypothetical protein